MSKVSSLRGQLLKNISLAEYTSWKVGGPADTIYFPEDIDDLTCFLKTVPLTTPIYWLGLGSNVLIRDGGLEGVVIITQGKLKQITFIDPLTVRVEAGVACAKIARHTARLGLTGLEFMAGIPGTVGGALAMNAGCWGGETWQAIAHVDTINRAGEVRRRAVQDYTVGYRSVNRTPDEWFIAGFFSLKEGDKDRSIEDIRILLDKRSATQPTGLPNCGSVFRNPPGFYAAELIEQCGLKGKRAGGAVVSDKHANFIINEGSATAADLEWLIGHIQKTVFERRQVKLVTEVCVIGKVLGWRIQG